MLQPAIGLHVINQPATQATQFGLKKYDE